MKSKAYFELYFFIGHFVDVWNCLGQTPLFVVAYLAKVEMVNILYFKQHYFIISKSNL